MNGQAATRTCQLTGDGSYDWFGLDGATKLELRSRLQAGLSGLTPAELDVLVQHTEHEVAVLDSAKQRLDVAAGAEAEAYSPAIEIA